MLRIARTAALVAIAAGMARAQPALTTIQDILYRADGTRFSGTIFIRWNSFQTQDAANIATANLTLPVVNGVLSVKLAPTTTATAGARYNVTYNSQGQTQFTETWAVPPSSLTLRLRDVRLSQGAVVGPLPIVTPIQIADVIGLTNALDARPTEGVGFAIGRAAIINQAGQIEGAAGSLGDCVRVDGTSGACGGGGGVLPSFSDQETLGGTPNGSLNTFTLAHAPTPAASLSLFRNGLLLERNLDYTVSANTITFVPGSIPQLNDLLVANYRYADPSNPFSTLSAPEVVCASVGSTTASVSSVQIGSCTIPAGILQNGDRIEVRYRLVHSGGASGFTGEIHWGSSTIFSRSAAATEASLSASANLMITSGAQPWDTQSWGSALSFATVSGLATENITAGITLSFRAQLAAVTADNVSLVNFTVVRYPAQSNP